MNNITTAADFLADLRFTHRRVDALPAEMRPTDIRTGYQIQAALIERLEHKYGGQRNGYKIGCTSELAQKMLGSDGPFYGTILSGWTFVSPARLRFGDLSTCIIEIEFGFQMAADVPSSSAPYTAQSIAEFIGPLFPSIEIVSHRFNDWTKVGAPTLAADNAIHGAWVHGAPFADWHVHDLAQQRAELWVNGAPLHAGTGAAVLGHPLNVMAWLANELPQHGLALKRGDYVTTGVCTQVYHAKAGDVVRGAFGELGNVEVSFA